MDKPLNVRAHEAVYGPFTENAVVITRRYDTDDSAALDLLKAWQKSGPQRRMTLYFRDRGDWGWRCRLVDGNFAFNTFADSLAIAICQAIIATREDGQ